MKPSLVYSALQNQNPNFEGTYAHFHLQNYIVNGGSHIYIYIYLFIFKSQLNV